MSELLKTQNYINGCWVDAEDGSTLEVVNPANAALIGTVPSMSVNQINQAIESAHNAFGVWKKLTAGERADLMLDLYRQLLDKQQELANILTLEMGKPLSEAMGEIAFGAAYIRWYAEEGRRVYGDVIPSAWQDKRIVVTKEPIGVVGAITPWNFPNSMVTRKLGAALAAGCTIVIKPAEQTPYSALAIAALAEKVGIPAGVINVVTGTPALIADAMCEHEKLRKITFTGSTATGKILSAKAAAHMKRISMELGGNAPFIVFDDADIDSAVQGAMVSKFRNAGQTCVCANRILVQSGVAAEFTEKLVQAVNELIVGDGMSPSSEQGPLIDQRAVAKIQSHISDLVEKGGRVVTGGKCHSLGGTFFEPTVVTGASVDSLVAKEETFAPLAAVFTFDSETEALQMANNTRYGLAAYCYTKDLGTAWRMMEGLEYGLVAINEGLVASEVAPFGGVKESGFGKEGSKYGLDDFLNIKSTCLGGLGL